MAAHRGTAPNLRAPTTTRTTTRTRTRTAEATAGATRTKTTGATGTTARMVAAPARRVLIQVRLLRLLNLNLLQLLGSLVGFVLLLFP